MAVIKETREQMGISQQSMAEYLGVSRQSLSLAEIDLRHLPGDVGQKALQLFDGLQLGEPLAALPAQQARAMQEAAETQAAVAQRLTQIQHEVGKWGAKLEQHQKMYERAIRCVQSYGDRLAAQPDPRSKDALWLKLRLSEAEALADQHHPSKAALLQARLAGLQAEAKALEELGSIGVEG